MGEKPECWDYVRSKIYFSAQEKRMTSRMVKLHDEFSINMICEYY